MGATRRAHGTMISHIGTFLPAAGRPPPPRFDEPGDSIAKHAWVEGMRPNPTILYYNSGGYDLSTKERHGFQGDGHGLVRIPATSQPSQESEDGP